MDYSDYPEYLDDTYEESYPEDLLEEELADDLADLRRDVEQSQNHSYDSYYSDDDFEDFDLESEKSPRFSDDTFKMDFIDL